jgi:hypothetical protein
MKNEHWLLLALALSTSLAVPQALAQQAPALADQKATADPAGSVLKPGPAVVKPNVSGTVMVRGQAAISSEVVTRLSKGQPVTVLETVTLSKPKEDEPAHWAKIALPTNVAVWVSGLYVDPVTKTVKGTRLNLRSGPGENYSVLGRIAKGAAVKEIETKGDWLKIEPPADTFAFVAAHLLANAPAAVEVAVVTPPPVTPTEPVAPPPVTPVAPVEPVAPAQPVTPTVEVKPPETNAPPTAPTAPVQVPEVKPEPPAEPPAVVTPPPEEVTLKRVVSREGYVRNTVSIQAPSYFKLESLDTRKTVNYVFSPTTNILMRDFFGKRIIVTGEEVLDERWPNTPVINVESIRTVPQ